MNALDRILWADLSLPPLSVWLLALAILGGILWVSHIPESAFRSPHQTRQVRS